MQVLCSADFPVCGWSRLSSRDDPIFGIPTAGQECPAHPQAGKPALQVTDFELQMIQWQAKAEP